MLTLYAGAHLSSDGGQPFNPRPHEAIRIVIQSLHERGLAADAIQTICIENQKKLLNLSDVLPAQAAAPFRPCPGSNRP